MLDQVNFLPDSKRKLSSLTGTESDVAVRSVLMCAGMSSGPSLSMPVMGPLGGKALQGVGEIHEHGGVRVFLDAQRGRSVGAKIWS